MAMKAKTEKKRRQTRAGKSGLRIVSVQFTPMPGMEQKLAKVYELLLAHNSEESRTKEGDRATSEKRRED